MVDSGSIPGRVKPEIRKIGIHSFPARCSAIKRTVPPRFVVDKETGGSLTERKQISLRFVSWQGNLMNQMYSNLSQL